MSQTANSPSLDRTVRIRMAVKEDAEPLARLINAAFVVERPFIEGERIDPAGVREYMGKGKFLVAEDGLTLLDACTWSRAANADILDCWELSGGGKARAWDEN